jgi:predicted nucleotidyltransferase/DNA-binding HxlR family transcriptional regulator
LKELILALTMSTIALSMRAESGALAHMLFGKARGALLALLYGHPDESFYYRQITRRLGNISTGTLQRELETLSRLGLVDRTTVGNQVFYRANRNHPVFSELRALVAKTVGAIQVLREALASIADRISIAFIYGSMARGQEKAESDIDLLIVGKVTLEDVLGSVSNIELSLGRSVNPTVYSSAEFKAKLASGNHFLNSVARGEKIFLIGDENELREVGGIRMAEAGAHESR